MAVLAIPNAADAAYSISGFKPQASPDSQDYLILSRSTTGVITGATVTAQGIPDMTVAVAAGEGRIGNTAFTIAAGNVTIDTADANPRFDLVVVDNTGAKSVIKGAAHATNPVFPAIPSTNLCLAAVYVPASDTDIDADQIYDRGASALSSLVRGSCLLDVTSKGVQITGVDGLISIEGAAPINNQPYSVVSDVAGTNLLPNSSFETNTTSWSALGSTTLTRSSGDDEQYVGDWGLRIEKTTASANDGVETATVSAVAATTYTASVALKAGSGANPNPQTIQLKLVDSTAASSSSYQILLGTGWVKVPVTHTTAGGATTIKLQIITYASATQLDFYIDSVQLEIGSWASTYIDGSLGVGYAWNGTAHASSSTRTAGFKYTGAPITYPFSVSREGSVYIGRGAQAQGSEAADNVLSVGGYTERTSGGAITSHVVAYVNASGNSSAAYGAFDSTVATWSGNIRDYTGFFYGVGGAFIHLGTGTVSGQVFGVSGAIYNGYIGLGGNGVITSGWALGASAASQLAGGSGSLTTVGGLYVVSQTVGSTNNYGAFINMSALSNGIGATTDSIGLKIPSATIAMGNQTATTTNFFVMSLGAMTLTSTTNVRTITNAATLYIAGPPVESTNVAFTNPAISGTTEGFSLWVDAGDVRIDSRLSVGNTIGPAVTDLITVGAGFTGAAVTWLGAGGVAVGLASVYEATSAVTIAAIGLYGKVNVASGGGTVPWIIAIEADVPTISGTAVTRWDGLYIPTSNIAGVTAGYGVYIQDAKTFQIWCDGATPLRIDAPIFQNYMRYFYVVQNTRAATLSTVGNAAVPTITSPTAATSQVDARGNWLRISATTNNATASILWAAFTHTQTRHSPVFEAVVQIPTALTNRRVWIGLFSATPEDSNDPAINALAFRYVAGTDTNWRCYSNDGTSTGTSSDSGVAVAADTKYIMRIDCTDTANIKYYINDVLVFTQTANLPATTADLAMGMTLDSLSASGQKDLDMNYMGLRSLG